MNAPNDNTAAKGLRGWWLSPPRSGMHRLISPWEYRHLRASGVTRAAAGGFQLGIGLVLLSLGRSTGTDQERTKCTGCQRGSWCPRQGISRVATNDH
jgi:hypothetical protein